MSAHSSTVHRSQAQNLLPQKFEPVAKCRKYRRLALGAAPTSKAFLAEKCSPKKRCNSGLCPLCIRALRVRFVEFLHQEKLHERQWFFVTAYIRGWTKKPGDLRRFGQLGSHPQIKAFVQRLRRLEAPSPMLFGAIETVWRTNYNKATGKPFHLHFMVSGPSKAQVKEAAGRFDLDTSVRTPLRVDAVPGSWEDFRDTATYAVKQPFWKYSYHGLGPKKRRQFPNRQELAELISNLGPHRVHGRLVFAGMQYKHGRFELTRNMKSMSARSQVEDGSNNPADAEKRPPNGFSQTLSDIFLATLQAGKFRPTIPISQLIETKGVPLSTPSSAGEVMMHTQDTGRDLKNASGTKSAATAARPASKKNFLKLVRTEYSERTGNYEVVLRFRTQTGVVEAAFPKSELLSGPSLRRLLVDKGAILPDDFEKRREEILRNETSTIVTVANASGWRGDAFVCPFGVFGNSKAAKNVRPERLAEERRHVSGTATEFLAGIKPFLQRSNILILAYLAALTPSLAARIGMTDSFALNLMQKTSTGKTTALCLAHSLMTSAPDERDLVNFNETLGIQQDKLPHRGGWAVPYTDLKGANEEGKALAHKIRVLVFSAATGLPRERKGEAPPPKPAFSIPMLSSEIPMADLFRQNGSVFQGGDAVRLIEINVPLAEEGGIFVPKEGETSGQLVTDLKTFLREQHGTILPKWLAFLSRKEVAVTANYVHQGRQRFLEIVAAPETHQQRIANHFSLLAAVGWIAAKKKLIPLEPHEVEEALRHLYNSRIAAEMTTSGKESELWALFFDRIAGKNMFPLAREGEAPANAARYERGFRREEGGQKRLYVMRSALDAAIPHKWFVDEKLLPRLLKLGGLQAGHGAWTARVKQTGLSENKRYLRFNLDRLRDLKDELS